MKTLVFIYFLIFSTQIWAQNDAISKYFQQYADDEGFTSVFVSKNMFNLFSSINIDDPDFEQVKSVLGGLSTLHILTTEDKELDGLKYYKEAIQKIGTKEYQSLMQIRVDGEHVQFLIKQASETKKIEELLLLVGSKSQFVMISLVGSIDLDKISKLADHMNLPGLQHLEKIDEKKEAH